MEKYRCAVESPELNILLHSCLRSRSGLSSTLEEMLHYLDPTVYKMSCRLYTLRQKKKAIKRIYDVWHGFCSPLQTAGTLHDVRSFITLASDPIT